jgi:integrase
MPKIAKALSAIEVSRLGVGTHSVGGVAGLLLNVSATGSRSWLLRVKVGNKRREIGLGPYPAVKLAEASQRALATKEKIASGTDPVAEKVAARRQLIAAQAKARTFEECTHDFLLAKRAEWSNAKHAAQWASTLQTYAFPVIGSIGIANIETAHLMSVLTPIWTSKTETASRLRGRIESILSWASVQGLRAGDNPARWRGHLDQLLPAPTRVASVEHFASMPYSELAAFMVVLRNADGVAASALEFAILCASRSGEVRGARWDEIDLTHALGPLWTIPAARMKAGKEHRVPLSGSAVHLLSTMPRANELVFPAPRGGQLSDMSLTALLRRLNVAYTAHGFRSSFRVWAAERTNYPTEMIELALAHTQRDAVVAAYQRSDLLERRRVLMNDWADFIGSPVATATVVPLRQAS